jgi:uncharacterized protein (TIGR03083 family)
MWMVPPGRAPGVSCHTGAMQPAEYLAHVRSEGEALAAAGRRAPDAAVVTCPGWDVTELVIHTGRIHRWAADLVTSRSPGPMGRQTPPERAGDPEGVLSWYDEGLGGLLVALAAVGPDEPVWNFSAGQPAPSRFWHRRMAHETAIHRWDAEAAGGDPAPVERALATDGIDEYLDLLPARIARRPVPGLSGSLHLHATDGDGEWWLGLAPDHIEQRREHAKADAAVRGPSSELLLWLLNRRPPDSPELSLFGDRGVVEAWRDVTF